MSFLKMNEAPEGLIKSSRDLTKFFFRNLHEGSRSLHKNTILQKVPSHFIIYIWQRIFTQNIPWPLPVHLRLWTAMKCLWLHKLKPIDADDIVETHSEEGVMTEKRWLHYWPIAGISNQSAVDLPDKRLVMRSFDVQFAVSLKTVE